MDFSTNYLRNSGKKANPRLTPPFCKNANTPTKVSGLKAAGSKSQTPGSELEQSLPVNVLGGKAKLQAPAEEQDCSAANQRAAATVDLFEERLDQTVSAKAVEAISQIDIDKELPLQSGEAQTSRHKLEIDSTSVQKEGTNEGHDVCRHTPEMENFVFLKSTPDADLCATDIIETKTAKDETPKNLEEQGKNSGDIPKMEDPQAHETQSERKVVRLAISLLSGDTEAAAQVIDTARQEARELSNISRDEADLLETAFQILTKELRLQIQSPPESRRPRPSHRKWCLLLCVTVLSCVALLWLSWNQDGEEEWSNALPT